MSSEVNSPTWGEAGAGKEGFLEEVKPSTKGRIKQAISVGNILRTYHVPGLVLASASIDIAQEEDRTQPKPGPNQKKPRSHLLP